MMSKKFFFILLSTTLSLALFPVYGSDLDEGYVSSCLSSSSSGRPPIIIEMDDPPFSPPQGAALIHMASAKQLDQGLQNLYQDVNGYEDDCLRWSICCWRFSGNTAQTLSMITSLGATVFSGVAAIPGLLDDKTKETFIIIATLASLSNFALIALKKYSTDAIIDRREQLKQVLHDHGIDIPLDEEEGAP